jgi:ribosomal protein L12E/L44/L45/RPP1/RPP2
MRSFLRALTFTVFAFASCAAFAETKPAPAKPTAQAPQAKQELKMETVQLAALIKSTIMALQHANQTGNYSVLRDLGTPVFRERFDLAQLTAIFSNLRSRSVNLSPVLFLAPNLTKQPELTEGNQLRIVGDFPTQPLKIQYEMLFLQIDGVWRIDGLAIDAVPQQSTAAAPAASAPPSTVQPAGHQQPAKRAANNTSEKKPQKTTSQ